VRHYVNESRHEIYDWLTGLGVEFEKNVLLMPAIGFRVGIKLSAGGLVL